MSEEEKSIFNNKEKESKIYKFFDFFIDDSQKESLLISGAFFLLSTLSRISYLKEEVMDGGTIIKVSSEDRIFIMSFDQNDKLLAVLYRLKNGFLSNWQRIELPPDIQKMLGSIKNKKEAKKKLAKVMTMKAFW